jgi:hypothetical protein
VVGHLRETQGTEALGSSLADWKQRLTDRGRAMLTAAARLSEFLEGP